MTVVNGDRRLGRVFDIEVQRILDYVGRGIGVRVIGAPGSGKTTVISSAVANAEKTGFTIHSVTGLRTHRNIPYAAVKGLGMEMRPGRSGVLDLADVMVSQLAKPGKHLMMVDDIQLLDNESLAVLEAVRQQSFAPMIATAPETHNFTRGQLAVLNQGREAVVQLDPLHYEQVHALIAKVLGGPADVDTTARILTKSAGNPRLIVRITETALLSNLLVRRDGMWHMSAGTLWNDHLSGTVEALLAELPEEDVNALHSMAILGTARIDVLQKIVSPDVLDRLERRGFLSVMDDHHNGTIAAISPPVIVDYFRGRRTLRDRHLLRSRIAGLLESSPQVTRDETSTADCLSRALSALRLERGNDDAVTARHFQDHNAVRERARFERWEANKTATNAAALLRVYWGAPVDPVRTARVLTETPTDDADPSELLFLTITKALLAIPAGGASAAVEVLQAFGDANPELKADAEAAMLFLGASHGRVPEQPAGVPEVGARTFEVLTQALLELYRCRPTVALKLINDVDNDELFPHLRPFIHGYALFAAGRVDESLVFALEWRAEARKNLDQFGVVTSSYVAVHGLLYSGYFDEAEYLMSSVFAMGRPGFVVDLLYDAMLRLAGLRQATTSTTPTLSIASQARSEMPDVGPLPGIGKGPYVLVTTSDMQPAAFDKDASKLIKRQLKSGYVLEAKMTALLCTCLAPGRRVLDLLQKVLRDSGILVHDQFVAIAAAVVETDHQLLGLLLKHYEPDQDVYQVGMLLRSALRGHVLEGDTTSAEALATASSAFAARFPSENEQLSFNTFEASALTEREIEIAALAGYLSNVQIGERLRISARTVENHISNALRKTGATSRTSLFILVGNTFPPQ
ncbi:LuxR C-terminal-related transcriptional regulator [Paenarthrobacter sp. NPDC089989]|uniref:LuxR C-terminal-related transcriptional regulator n=1 Tax=unclassified Paenarthrobacter TaxID=2634190 RepID=UPI003820E7F1